MLRIARALPALVIPFTLVATLGLLLLGCGADPLAANQEDQESLDGNWRISSAGKSDIWFRIAQDRVVSWSWYEWNANEGGPELTSYLATISGNTAILSWSWFVMVNDTDWYMQKFAFSGTLQDDGTYLGTFSHHYSDNCVLFDLGEESYDAAMVRW